MEALVPVADTRALVVEELALVVEAPAVVEEPAVVEAPEAEELLAEQESVRDVRKAIGGYNYEVPSVLHARYLSAQFTMVETLQCSAHGMSVCHANGA